MDTLTLWKIKRITLAKKLGVPPTYLDDSLDAPNFGEYINVRRFEINDMAKVMDAAIMAYNQHGVRVFPDWNLPPKYKAKR